MKARKIQVTGGASYSITLPKSWINSKGLGKNHVLGVAEMPDGTLTVSADFSDELRFEEKTFRIKNDIDQRLLFRLLVSAYIGGYSPIRVVSEKRMDSRIRETVNEFVQAVIGFETLEETDSHIHMEDILDQASMPFENSIKRMHVMVRNMHKDAAKAVTECEMDLAKDVISTDSEIDRLYWLISRQSSLARENPLVADKLNAGTNDVIFYGVVGRIMERIGDHAVIIARNPPFSGKREGQKVKASVGKASKQALKMFEDSMSSWYAKDIGKANKTIESMQDLKLSYEKILDQSHKSAAVKRECIGYVAESLLRTGAYSKNISEHVINQLIESA